MTIINFRGDLTDISDKKEPLCMYIDIQLLVKQKNHVRVCNFTRSSKQKILGLSAHDSVFPKLAKTRDWLDHYALLRERAPDSVAVSAEI